MSQYTPIIVYILLGAITAIVLYLLINSGREVPPDRVDPLAWSIIILGWPVALLSLVWNTVLEWGKHE